jgi:hypothetical protein
MPDKIVFRFCRLLTVTVVIVIRCPYYQSMYLYCDVASGRPLLAVVSLISVSIFFVGSRPRQSRAEPDLPGLGTELLQFFQTTGSERVRREFGADGT